ncbi:hypothetical protein [Tardiphaga sp.]|uniref:hypothetical protein n=1 Tax=Tardiphaga sp. TaxID=1926292 RepID=UPI00352AC312
MTTVSDQWTEILRCRICALTGVASLSLNGNDAVYIKILPSGFKAVSSQYGDTFYCEGCNRTAGTSLK